ncbi:MAG: DUF86 domain-containing protein [Candidatus Celaenobacter polaris]|nr:DUF86 domain-containing protein [Candidatus Celaenobacter polaris]
MSDFDTELVIEILHQIKSSCDLIVSRVEHIITYSDFIKNDAGLEKLDAVSMQLIAIGESIKNLDKITDYEILIKYPEFEWKKAMAMRDIISHHYFDLNPEIVFDVCKNEISRLSTLLDEIIDDIENYKS